MAILLSVVSTEGVPQPPAPGPMAAEPEEANTPDTGGPQRGHHSRVLLEWVVVTAIAVVLALIVRSYVFEAFYIPSPSMQPTLQPHDRVVVNRLAYDFHAVRTGDVIVFRRPPADTSTTATDLIKRVIGLPGQSIYVHDCRVYINGKLLAQPYLPAGWQGPASEYCTLWDQPGMLHLPNPYRVPKGEYFMMGDNRKDSDDSRYWGALPGKYIIGRAFLKIWPVNRIDFL